MDISTDLVDELLSAALERIASHRCVPGSTYRLQFHAGFTFRDAAAITPYLAELGITHCYASPYFKARSCSMHGYDVVDPTRLNPEIGTTDEYETWLATLKDHGLSHILDIVPNHMGVGTNENPWWNDVLRNGSASNWASFFDIAWRGSPRAELHDKVLLPVLGEPYGDVLEKGQIRLVHEAGEYHVAYYDRRFPIAANSLSPPNALKSDGSADAKVVDDLLRAINGTPGDPRSFDRLHSLLEAQHYRLADWRVASDEINYRRFFDVNDLAALRTEEREVFVASHALILKLLAHGKISGLRVDHPDGLLDPKEYLLRLQRHFVLAVVAEILRSGERFKQTDFAALWPQLVERLKLRILPGTAPNLYVVVEKILAPGEELPQDWMTDGTSGYDFLNVINSLFVDTRQAAWFTRMYVEFTNDVADFAEIVYQSKKRVLTDSFGGELDGLARRLDKLAQADRHARDFTLNSLRDALAAMIACFPVYRTYIADGNVSETDHACMENTIREATRSNPKARSAIFEFIRDTLLMCHGADNADEMRAEQRHFAQRFQQLTAPVTAKGVEDTAFYIYNRLASLNEVGGSPDRFGMPADDVHRYLARRQACWPQALSTLSTHDTKRAEDVRARINVLSELPEEWWPAVSRWSQLNAQHGQQLENFAIPDRNEECLLYQTLIGAWPIEPCTDGEFDSFVGRIQAYMEKVLREAKVHTSWTNPNPQYEQAIRNFVASILDEQTGKRFLEDFRPFHRRISHFGMINSLSQTLLRLAAPGVPDTYQGTELWDFSLVDPDNRRPVDYALRQKMLLELKFGWDSPGDSLSSYISTLAQHMEDGRAKLLIIWRMLQLRRQFPGLFSSGDYVPLKLEGERKVNLFAFLREKDGQRAVIAVPRMVTELCNEDSLPLGRQVWGETRVLLPPDVPSRWSNALTREELTVDSWHGSQSLRAADLLSNFSVAVVLSRGEGAP